MENIRKIEPMGLRDAAVALLEAARAIERAKPYDAAYVAGYIARVVEDSEPAQTQKERN
ncbi:MAG: hypothetical protein IJ381_01820 [Clostridia bacterium]|nr:hypothetical protein [Clostridia bacterium]